jgi:hypothetical protein
MAKRARRQLDGSSGVACTTTHTLMDWLETFIRQSERGEVAAISAGCERGRDYAYLHYRTRDGHHSVLVFRAVPDGAPGVHALRVDAEPPDVAARIDRATHGPLQAS